MSDGFFLMMSGCDPPLAGDFPRVVRAAEEQQIILTDNSDTSITALERSDPVIDETEVS